jgi:hypothetical protein
MGEPISFGRANADSGRGLREWPLNAAAEEPARRAYDEIVGVGFAALLTISMIALLASGCGSPHPRATQTIDFKRLTHAQFAKLPRSERAALRGASRENCTVIKRELRLRHWKVPSALRHC